MNPNTGGPAFPQHGWTKDPEVLERMRNQGGMTLLDWYAGQALASLSVFTAEQPYIAVEGVAGDAYDLAEAMLAEKARREGVVKESSTTDDSGKMAKLEALNRELVEACQQAIELINRPDLGKFAIHVSQAERILRDALAKAKEVA